MQEINNIPRFGKLSALNAFDHEMITRVMSMTRRCSVDGLNCVDHQPTHNTFSELFTISSKPVRHHSIIATSHFQSYLQVTMAPKRPISTPSVAQRNQQATITFGKQGLNRVTKTTLAQRDIKATKKDSALLDAVSSHDIDQPTTADAAIEEQAEAELVDIKPRSSDNSDDYEKRAIKVSNAQIKKYWQAKESERKCPRVHQQGLDVSEKILREFDMSGQYGVSDRYLFLPC
jgi:DNA polymerase delta subunit 4